MLLTGVTGFRHCKQKYHRRLIFLLKYRPHKRLIGILIKLIHTVVYGKLNENNVGILIKHVLFNAKISQY
jgi:hypothetical protein